MYNLYKLKSVHLTHLNTLPSNNSFSIKSNISLLFTKNYKFERFRDKNKQYSAFDCLGRQQTIKKLLQFYVFVLILQPC